MNIVVYWDASAILSALFQDSNSQEAQAWSRREGIHLVSSLSMAEVYAVISRIQREKHLAGVLVDAALEALELGPWRRLNVSPDWNHLKALARKWPLRGADLWHLATAKTIHVDLPELTLLTFDSRLRAASQGEGLA